MGPHPGGAAPAHLLSMTSASLKARRSPPRVSISPVRSIGSRHWGLFRCRSMIRRVDGPAVADVGGLLGDRRHMSSSARDARRPHPVEATAGAPLAVTSASSPRSPPSFSSSSKSQRPSPRDGLLKHRPRAAIAAFASTILQPSRSVAWATAGRSFRPPPSASPSASPPRWRLLVSSRRRRRAWHRLRRHRQCLLILSHLFLGLGKHPKDP